MGKFSTFLAASVVTHVIAVAAVFLVPTQSSAVVSVAQKSITLSIGMQTALAGGQNIPIPVPVTKPEIEKKLEEKPIPKEKLKPKPKKAFTPKPKPKEKVKKEVQPKPEPKAFVKPIMAGNMGINGSTQSNVKQAETGQQKTFDAGALATAKYDALIRKHILSKKRYPKRLKMKKLKGTVTVTFTLDRTGKLSQQVDVKRSGIYEFDIAAKRLIRNAGPYPKPPSEVTWQTRSYKIDINYDWR